MDKTYVTLNEYWGIAIALAIGCASVLLSREALVREVMKGPIAAITVIAVLLTTLFLFGLYINATRKELELARDYKYIERSGEIGAPQVLIIMALALCFGGLLAFVTDLLVYASIMTGLQVTDFVAIAVARRRFENAESTMGKRVPSRLASIHDFYLMRSHLLLRSARILGCVIGLGLAVVATRLHSRRTIEIGWAVIIFSNLAAEYVMHGWRQVRDRNLASSSRTAAA